MTDNALVYRRGHAWQQALSDLGAQARLTRCYRPRPTAEQNGSTAPCATNGCTPGLHQQPGPRRRPTPLLHTYNHHRARTALGVDHPSPASTTVLVATPRARVTVSTSVKADRNIDRRRAVRGRGAGAQLLLGTRLPRLVRRAEEVLAIRAVPSRQYALYAQKPIGGSLQFAGRHMTPVELSA
jgi:hypothetical protein